MIAGFKGEFRFLSNFWPAVVELDGLFYNSVEHAYQAAKTLDETQRQTIRESSKPGDAKKLGQKIIIRPDWEQVKLQVMESLVRQKFTNDLALKDKLVSTGDEEIEETNTWGDVFWGVCQGVGTNHLGKILMKIRAELSVKYTF